MSARTILLIATWLCALLLLVSAAQADEEMVAACGVDSLTELTSSLVSDSVVVTRLVFISFPDYSQQDLPSWADSLKDEFNAYIRSMSHNKQRLDITILRRPDYPNKAWIADHASSYYGADYMGLNREIMFKIRDAFQTNPWPGVEIAVMYQYRNHFPVAGWGGVYPLDFSSSDRLALQFTGNGNTCRFVDIEGQSINNSFNRTYVSYNTGHEYGHNLGFDHSPNTGDPAYNVYYVNVGRYDCMRANGGGGIYNQGLLPYGGPVLEINAPSWLPDSVLTSDKRGLRIKDERDLAAKTYRITIAGSPQYFLLANHQGTGVDAKFGATANGLLVWHVNPNYDFGYFDVERADGKYDNIGQQNQSPNPVSGKDSLEAYAGFKGSYRDFFTASKPDFSITTNPHTFLYSDSYDYTSPQNVRKSIAFENIRKDLYTPDMIVDVFIDPKQYVTSPNGGELFARGQTCTLELNRFAVMT